MTRRLRRIAVAVALLAVVVVGLRSAWAFYACGVDGQARAACCCPAKPAHAPADGESRIKAAGCCELTLGEASRAPVAREAAAPQAVDAPAAVVAVASFAVTHRFAMPPARLDLSRPPPAVPTYLANRAILR